MKISSSATRSRLTDTRMDCKIIFPVVAILAMCGPVLSLVKVKPFMIAANPGQTVEFICHNLDNNTLDAYLEWSIASDNQENTTKINSTGRVSSINGTLTISNITYEDSQTYICKDIFTNATDTGILKVYDMPDYMIEGIIIAGICLGLILVLVIGSSLMFARQRRQRKRRLAEAGSKLARKHQLYKEVKNQ